MCDEEKTKDRQKVPFWETTPLDELIEQQQVAPVADIDELGALLPADDDPDKFLQHVLEERAMRKEKAMTNYYYYVICGDGIA